MKTSSLHSSRLSLALLLLLLITTSLVEATNAKRACNGTVADCNGDEEWLMESDTVRQLLQSGNSGSYASLQRQSACAGSNGGAYENTCFSRVNTQSRGCDPTYGCRNS
ncbi:hypothetical protein QJS10_CPB04g01302 [Acorus calamus]|uniref:Uncharacterized protein n=1 Tax=Acorus calamus TaxID=4465 RepID=A0AAV9F3F0_ACOCL|nr:hypothetical protein QJS10_CPB04g01299 [Acorus calamus]KAK1319425.1 hypothetical protein QJS10_CPB04g01302 [Acorus calamus]